MKNLIIILGVVFILSPVSATFAQSLGIKAGFNLSNMISKDNDLSYSDDFKLKPGFQIGTIAEFPITNSFSLETGLIFSNKGYKSKETEMQSGLSISIYKTVNLYYTEIPLLAKLSYTIGEAKVYGSLGPYFGIGVLGKINIEYMYLNQKEIENADIKWGSSDEEMNQIDYGLNLGFGVEVSSVQIGVSYEYGLGNLSNTTENGFKWNNRIFSLTLAYKFLGK